MSSHSINAIVIDEPGRLRRAQIQLDDPGPNEVEVKIAAAGVCGSDLHVFRGEWDVRFPMVMGHEGSGYVTRVGKGVTHLGIGDHVVLSWNPPCRTCRNCRAGRAYSCQRAAELLDRGGVLFDGSTRFHEPGHDVFHYLGVSSWAEAVVVPASGAIRIPSTIALDSAALAGCALPTGIGAVSNTANLQSGANVLVIGCGGVGLSCIQGARLREAATIVAVDLDPSRLELALRMGATETIGVASDEAWATLRSRYLDGFDTVFDAVGTISTMSKGMGLLGLAGSLVIVGLSPSGSILPIDPLSLAMSNQRILGSNYGSIDPEVDIPHIISMIENGTIEVEPLITSRHALADAELALDDLANGRALRQLLLPSRGV
jgi:S-(hydroxymethyl)glutathione dehydrogenase/alcohol dehydrogenase